MADRIKRKPRYQIVLEVEGSRIDSVIEQAKAEFRDGFRLVRKVELSKSRADRLDEIAGLRDDISTGLEELRDELQEWYDNLPENFQSGDKGSELEESISALESLKDQLEAVDFGSVSFPSMM